MRIVHYLSSVRLEDGGVVHAVADMCLELARAGHAVELLTFEDRDVDEVMPERPATMSVRRLERGGGPLGALKPRGADESIRDADVVHLHTPWDIANLGIAKLCRRVGTPYVLSTHGMLDRWAMSIRPLKKRVFLRLAGYGLLRGASCVVSTSDEEAEQCREVLPGVGVRALPLFCGMSFDGEAPAPLTDEAFERLLPEVPSGRALVGFFGRVFMGKGLRVLIPALGVLRRSGRACDLLIAGPVADDFRDELDALCEREGVREHVHFLGRVSGERKSAALRAMRVKVLASIHENFGLVAPEALAVGTPVIATKGVAIWRELERTGGAAISEREPEALARAIEPFVDDGAMARDMGLRGREGLRAWLDPARVREGYEELYRLVVGA